MNWSKVILLISNFFAFLFLLLIFLNSAMIVTSNGVLNFYIYPSSLILFISITVLSLFLAFLGCYLAKKNNREYGLIYITLMIYLIFIILFLFGDFLGIRFGMNSVGELY